MAGTHEFIRIHRSHHVLHSCVCFLSACSYCLLLTCHVLSVTCLHYVLFQKVSKKFSPSCFSTVTAGSELEIHNINKMINLQLLIAVFFFSGWNFRTENNTCAQPSLIVCSCNLVKQLSIIQLPGTSILLLSLAWSLKHNGL